MFLKKTKYFHNFKSTQNNINFISWYIVFHHKVNPRKQQNKLFCNLLFFKLKSQISPKHVCGYPLRNVTNTSYNHISWVDIYLYINFSYKTWWDSPLVSDASCKSIRKLTKFAPKNHVGECNFSFIISQFTIQQYLFCST